MSCCTDNIVSKQLYIGRASTFSIVLNHGEVTPVVDPLGYTATLGDITYTSVDGFITATVDGNNLVIDIHIQQDQFATVGLFTGELKSNTNADGFFAPIKLELEVTDTLCEDEHDNIVAVNVGVNNVTIVYEASSVRTFNNIVRNNYSYPLLNAIQYNANADIDNVTFDTGNGESITVTYAYNAALDIDKITLSGDVPHEVPTSKTIVYNSDFDVINYIYE